MSKKITGFFKKLSISKLPQISSDNELPSTEHNSSTESYSPIVSDFLASNSIEIDPASSAIPFNRTLKPVRPAMSIYPKNSEGNKFNSRWYSDHPWLEYSKSKNAAFCFVCRHFGENNGYADPTYTKEGFTCFRKGPRRFKEHSISKDHLTAAHLYSERLLATDSVATKVNSQHKKEILENRSYLTIIFQIIIWLCRQGSILEPFFFNL